MNLSNSLRKAEDIARKLQLEIQALSSAEAMMHFQSKILEIPEEYRPLVDALVGATLVYGHKTSNAGSTKPVNSHSSDAIPVLRSGWGNMKKYARVLLTFGALIVTAVVLFSVLPPISGIKAQAGKEELREIRNDGRDNLIIFVHGLRDDGSLTWTNAETDKNWAQMLVEDNRFESFDLMSYHYSSMLFQAGSLSISNVADQLAFRMDSEAVDNYENIIFVAHSMGGLVVRNLLLKNDTISEKVPLIYFLATPTAGSDVARLASLFDLANRQLDAMTSFEESNFLADQYSTWRGSSLLSEIFSLCAFETVATNGLLVVEQVSAQSLCSGRTIPSGENHSGIAKPYSEESLVYAVFADRIETLIGSEQLPASDVSTDVVSGIFVAFRDTDLNVNFFNESNDRQFIYRSELSISSTLGTRVFNLDTCCGVETNVLESGTNSTVFLRARDVGSNFEFYHNILFPHENTTISGYLDVEILMNDGQRVSIRIDIPDMDLDAWKNEKIEILRSRCDAWIMPKPTFCSDIGPD